MDPQVQKDMSLVTVGPSRGSRIEALRKTEREAS